ncbi:MAG TPA: TonB family protein [Lacunisphaera sp.]|jgi:TonB family protein|nr:TonB family protein [Lacunisphaera sp.]
MSRPLPTFLAVAGLAAGACGLPLPAAETSAPAAPPALRSHPPRALHMVAPVHPPELRKKLIGGQCLVECLVSPAGRVVDTKVLSATDPAFGPAAVEALRQWEFQPGERDGQPIAMKVQIPFDFTFSREEILNTVAGYNVFADPQGTVIPAQELPNWPQPIHIYLPPFPKQLEGTGKHGKAVVSIVVDQQGNVLKPRIVKSTYPEFDLPALATAVRLKYEPQSVGNKHSERICVSMDIEFDFKDPVALRKNATEKQAASDAQKKRAD